MNSALYECTVMHRRLKPKVHGFVYRIFLFWIDLDELEEIAKRIPFFSANRANLYSFHDADHFPGGRRTARENVVEFLVQAGESRKPAAIRVLTLPRLLGYTFNPISIFFCFGEDGRAFTSVVEVENTFRERKAYLVPVHDDGGFAARTPKHFYVSPFSDLDLEFDFRFDLPGECVSVSIDDYRGEECELVSHLGGRRRALTGGTLAGLTLKYPFVTMKVILGIHWEAFRLWLKRVPFHKKEQHRDLQRGVFNPHKSLR